MNSITDENDAWSLMHYDDVLMVVYLAYDGGAGALTFLTTRY